MDRRIAIATAGLAIALTGCGRGVVPGIAGDGGESASAGGPSVPHQFETEDYPWARETIGGEVLLAGNGCWYLAHDDKQSMVVWPQGAELGDNGDRVEVPSRAPVSSGDVIEASGAFVPGRALPGGADGYWGYITGYCDDGDGDVALLDDLAVLFDAASAVPLADDYGCGLGFSVASADQHFALLFSPEIEGAGTPAGVSLPDADWAATLVVGRDLMSNWCDDVVEPGEPEPVVYARWSVTVGSLAFDPPLDQTGRCDGTDVRAAVTGLRATRADGSEIEIADRTIFNSAYGCFAG